MNRRVLDISYQVEYSNLQIEEKEEDRIFEDDCCICLCEIKEKGKTVLDCGHMIHTKCFLQMLINGTQNKNKCPYCRADQDIPEIVQDRFNRQIESPLDFLRRIVYENNLPIAIDVPINRNAPPPQRAPRYQRGNMWRQPRPQQPQPQPPPPVRRLYGIDLDRVILGLQGEFTLSSFYDNNRIPQGTFPSRSTVRARLNRLIEIGRLERRTRGREYVYRVRNQFGEQIQNENRIIQDVRRGELVRESNERAERIRQINENLRHLSAI